MASRFGEMDNLLERGHRQHPCCRHIHTGFERFLSTVYCGMLLAYLTGIGPQLFASLDVPVRTGSATGCEVAGARVANFLDNQASVGLEL
jgi:hypothetical protein